jgi:putative tricarboxylic transport membrane protein
MAPGPPVQTCADEKQTRAKGGHAPVAMKEEKLSMTDRVILVGIIILAAVYFAATEQLPSLEIGDPLGPKAFPRLLGVALIITAVMLLLEILRARKTAPAAGTQSATDPGAYKVVAAAAAWTLVYFLVFELLGYVISTMIYLLALMAYFNKGKWVANVLTAILFSLISYWMFKVLGVNLARGIMPF